MRRRRAVSGDRLTNRHVVFFSEAEIDRLGNLASAERVSISALIRKHLVKSGAILEPPAPKTEEETKR